MIDARAALISLLCSGCFLDATGTFEPSGNADGGSSATQEPSAGAPSGGSPSNGGGGESAGGAPAGGGPLGGAGGGDGGSPGCTELTIWNDSVTPTNGTYSDSLSVLNGVELGVLFQSEVPGVASGIRFYKGVPNDGAHVANLWALDGTLLATAPFTLETSSGWQRADFAAPVAITANTVYVASYFSPNGWYEDELNYFLNAFDNPPLHALQDGAVGPNGVYLYGTGFPTQPYASDNYWVDVVFCY